MQVAQGVAGATVRWRRQLKLCACLPACLLCAQPAVPGSPPPASCIHAGELTWVIWLSMSFVAASTVFCISHTR
jgi:hypothetical protein